jgi:hypothetical protein
LKFDKVLLDFWKTHAEKMRDWAIRGGQHCLDASEELGKYLDAQNINHEIISIGSFSGKKMRDGFIQVDIVDFNNPEMHLNDNEQIDMKKRGFDISKAEDVEKYIKLSSIEEDVKLIPHSWVEINRMGRYIVLDPSGFYPHEYGEGQFDSLVRDKDNLEKRYRFNGK